MNGLLNLYKPSGMSSAQAVSRVKHILGEKTVGHMGTLDPMAEGVLVIGVGKSARLFDYMLDKKKAYIAKFKFGFETDTLDALGQTVETTSDIPSADAVLHAAQSMIGRIEQIPPVYSAKHIDGKRAYKLAREGNSVEPKPVCVEIYDAQLITQSQPDELVFYIECSAGTYIRSICRDVARMCGSLATLTYLKRTRSGVFDVKDSVDFDAVTAKKSEILISPENALPDMKRITVPDELADDIDCGRKVECDFSGDAFVFCRGKLYGIGESRDGVLKLKTYLKD